MKTELHKTLQIIERMPGVLKALLQNLSDDWVYENEGENTWSPFDVVGHLIICELTGFLPRAEIILNKENETFNTIDRYEHLKKIREKRMNELLIEFEQLRLANIQRLFELNISVIDFEKTGLTTKVGSLKLSELLAAWAMHDFNHIYRLTTIMANQYKLEADPCIKVSGIPK